MVNILFITDLHIGSHIAQLDGVYSRAARHGWHVIEIEHTKTSRPLQDYINYWKPAGCILEGAALMHPINPKALSRHPVVYLDPDEETLAQPTHCIVSDPEPIARLAVDELSELPLESFGFVGWCEPTHWSEGRRKAFEAELSGRGTPVSSLCAPWEHGDTLRYQKKLMAWMKTLPKPVGILAANDSTAVQVLDAAHALGLACPQDVAVIGVDNLGQYCENAITSLSSIEIDFREAGARAADLLARVVADPGLPPTRLTYGARKVVRRQSTRKINSTDRRILHAVEQIRREAVLGLKAADVIRETGLSRRAAEQKFREATGKTILQEIYDNRFREVSRLLEDSATPIARIAEACGWESDAFLRRAFKKRTGMTMRDWRNRQGQRT